MTIAHRATIASIVVLLGVPEASAHRVDEYLQAARIDVAPDRVTVELSLTPGSDVAAAVLSAIDTDRNGEIGAREADAYATRLRSDLHLTVDDRAVPLTVSRLLFPEPSSIREGTGVIRLTATSAVTSPAGRHYLRFTNGHMPDVSVYLVNALVPASKALRFTAQDRDDRQRGISLEYDVEGGSGRTAWSIAAAVVVAGLLATRKPGTILPQR